MEIYGELKKDIGWILRKLCEERRRNYSGRSLPGSYSFVFGHTAKV
jgi:hypothetical protein